jgi:hypothetical protein
MDEAIRLSIYFFIRVSLAPCILVIACFPVPHRGILKKSNLRKI